MAPARKKNTIKVYSEYHMNSVIHQSILAKGKLISKCPFGAFKLTKKTNIIFERISALASKKRSNQKSSVRIKSTN